MHELVSASLHKLPGYCGKWGLMGDGEGRGGWRGVGGGAAGKLAKPRLVTDVDANCGFLITPSSPTVFSIFHFIKLTKL